jgi:glutamine amidotransferase-like uncharacterized protein
MAARAVVWTGAGACRFSAHLADLWLKRTLGSNAVTAASTLDFAHARSVPADVLCVAGGSGVDVRRALCGQGLRDWVARGGVYVGVCCGAYLAAAAVTYKDASTHRARAPSFGLLGERAQAVGPCFAPHVKTVHLDLCAASGSGRPRGGHPRGKCPRAARTTAYYMKGGSWLEASLPADATVRARYAATGAPAVVTREVGRGAVVCAGVHPEHPDHPHVSRFVGDLVAEAAARRSRRSSKTSSSPSLSVYFS